MLFNVGRFITIPYLNRLKNHLKRLSILYTTSNILSIVKMKIGRKNIHTIRKSIFFYKYLLTLTFNDI